MLIPKKNRNEIFAYLFKEGVLVAAKDVRPTAVHEDLNMPNLYVLKLLNSLKSKGFVREVFNWNHFYWFLTNEGIEYLREYLHLPEDVVPATLKKKAGENFERNPFGGRGRGRGGRGGFRGGRGGSRGGRGGYSGRSAPAESAAPAEAAPVAETAQ
eukprot:TRINITY_DN517_c0_g1_i1.p1 TRINITY_DN517_c0_g1~~TRINITY_DN517_c0_g1_i1.p1  ORF type:complete len:156 (+),score=54.50 TRINITY_DN517_c0_g1_i1:545-1012(+)